MKSTGQKLIASLALNGGNPENRIKSALMLNGGNISRTARWLEASLDSLRGAIETLDLGEWIHERWPMRSRGGRPVGEKT